MRPPNCLLRVAIVLLLAATVSAPTAAQHRVPAPGTGGSTNRYHSEFGGLLYGSDSGWVSLYPVTSAGETIDARSTEVRIVGLPDSLRPNAERGLPVLVRREYEQVGPTSPRLLQTTWRYAPEVEFTRFMTTLLLDMANAPDGDIVVFVNGEQHGMYSNRARYSAVAMPFWMERPFAMVRVTVDGKLLWEGRFVTVPERRSRMQFVAGGVQILSP